MVEEHLPHHPKAEDSSPTTRAGNGREKMVENSSSYNAQFHKDFCA